MMSRPAGSPSTRMRFSLHICLALAGSLSAGTAKAQSAQDSAQQVHDGITAIIQQHATRPIAVGDTFVGWWPRPVLYSTVRRSPNQVASSLVRADGLVGTAEAQWLGGRQTVTQVLWTQGDSTLLRWEGRIDRGALRFQGGRDTVLALPTLPWVIADYGMEDQMLPLIEQLVARPGRRRVVAYRPFAQKWDTMVVTVTRKKHAILATIENGPGDTDHWVITLDGALVRVTRDKYPGLERRPLELTARMADYKRLRDVGAAD
jgi:hypothetical protein